uniref:Potassium large conductance calcium-activated channel, subfamily M, beta member 2a n=1 Tax=Hucho hucho TaxID=62062 RepID=A0A4W5QM40_9TELE
MTRKWERVVISGLTEDLRSFHQSVRTASSVRRGGHGTSGKMFFVTGAKSAGWAASGGGAGGATSVWTEGSVCIVLNSTITADMNCSYSCGSDCWRGSKYPCLQVYVSVNTTGRVSRLSHNEESWDANFECFYVPKCQKDTDAMHHIIVNISERLKPHHQVLCYYDPSDQQESALLTRQYGHSPVFHSLFWPSCMLTGGTTIIFMVKLTQYLSIMCEQVIKIER